MDNDKTCTCDVCGMECENEEKLKAHKAEAHGLKMTGDGGFVCKMCGAKFATQAELDEHNQEAHPGQM